MKTQVHLAIGRGGHRRLAAGFLAACAGLALLGTAWAAAEVGDPAAPLHIAEWVKGQPVDLAAVKGQKIVVVEFWATWCPPCRASIPHLTELQRKYKDKGVLFIGISTEKPAVVKPFVTQMGAQMDYTVAIDQDFKTSEGYMEAYGIEGIPHAFIVDKMGRVAWVGHPMDGLDQTLELILAGKYDPLLPKKRARGGALLQQFVNLIQQGKDDASAAALAKEIEAIDQEVGGLMPGQKFDAADIRQKIKFRFAIGAFEQAITDGKDEADVEKLADTAAALAPKEVNFAAYKQQFELSIAFQSYLRAVTSGNADVAKIAELARRLRTIDSKNADQLNELAWVLLDDKKIKKRDPGLALTLARNASNATDGRDAAILDTYARALFETGKVEEAVLVEKRAIDAEHNAEMREELQATLKKYEGQTGKKQASPS